MTLSLTIVILISWFVVSTVVGCAFGFFARTGTTCGEDVDQTM